MSPTASQAQQHVAQPGPARLDLLARPDRLAQLIERRRPTVGDDDADQPLGVPGRDRLQLRADCSAIGLPITPRPAGRRPARVPARWPERGRRQWRRRPCRAATAPARPLLAAPRRARRARRIPGRARLPFGLGEQTRGPRRSRRRGPAREPRRAAAATLCAGAAACSWASTSPSWPCRASRTNRASWTWSGNTDRGALSAGAR